MKNITFLICCVLILSGCKLGPIDSQIDVIDRMYGAMEKNDMNAYMDTILPSDRQLSNPLSILNALSINLGPMGLDLGKLTQVSFRDLNHSKVRSDSNFALIKTEGSMRFPILGMEYKFCEEHDVRLENGQWYIDISGPESIARLQRISARNQLQYAKATQSNPNQSLQSIMQAYEVMLNLCE